MTFVMVVVIVLTGALVTVENAVWVVVVVRVVGVWAILVARWNLELSKKVKVMSYRAAWTYSCRLSW